MRSARPFRVLSATVVAIWLVASFAGDAAAAADGPQPLPPGRPAPSFASVDLDGKPFVLKDTLAEGPVALVFWSILCGSCREELPLLQGALPQFEANNVRLYAMNLDQASFRTPVIKYATQQGFTFPILLNESGDQVFGVEKIFGVVMTPAFFLIGADGAILYSHYGALEPEQLEPEVFSKLPRN